MHIRLLALGLSMTFLAALPAPARADTDSSIRLPQVLEVAVRQSPSLAAARIDLDVAEAQVIASLGIEDLLLQAAGNYLRQADESLAGDIIGTDKSSQVTAEASLSKLLLTGGTISLHANASRRSTVYSFDNSDVTAYTSQLRARFDQPLLRGRGKAISRANKEQAKHNLTAAELGLRGRARDEIHQVIDAYWELVWAHQDLEIRRSALQLAVERRRLTASAIRLGSAARTALVEVDQVMATNQEEILLAEQRVTERSLSVRRLAGLEIGPQHLDLHPAEDLGVSPRRFVLAEVLEKSLRASPELAALAERGKGATIAVKVASNAQKARLDLNLSAGPLGTSDSLGDSLAGLVTVDGYFVGGGLSYEQNIGIHGATGQRHEAQARVREVRVSERDLRAEIAVASSRAVQLAHIAKQRMELSRKAVGLSEQNIEAERRRFEAGRATNFDVLQRQEEQKQARLRFARAAVDYLKATISIQALTGELLERYGISL